MIRKKDLLDRILVLEQTVESLTSSVRELQNDLSHDIEVRQPKYAPLGYEIHPGGTYVTTNGKINAIIDHLKLDIKAVPPQKLPPKIEVTKEVTPRKRKAAKKGVEGEKSSQTA